MPKNHSDKVLALREKKGWSEPYGSAQYRKAFNCCWFRKLATCLSHDATKAVPCDSTTWRTVGGAANIHCKYFHYEGRSSFRNSKQKERHSIYRKQMWKQSCVVLYNLMQTLLESDTIMSRKTADRNLNERCPDGFTLATATKKRNLLWSKPCTNAL